MCATIKEVAGSHMPQGQREAVASAGHLCPAVTWAGPQLLHPTPMHQGCWGGCCPVAVRAPLGAALPSSLQAAGSISTSTWRWVVYLGN